MEISLDNKFNYLIYEYDLFIEKNNIYEAYKSFNSDTQINKSENLLKN